MKPTQEIIGLRIISISDGTQVGVVKDLVLNPQKKTLDFMIVDQPSDYLGAKIIAFKDILGLGEFAITIPHPGVIQDVAQNTEAQDLLKQDIRVLGTKVLTKKGQLIGAVTEILIDEETGQIAACLFESDSQIREIGAEQVITLGKELLIVEEVQAVPNEQGEEPSDEDRTPDITDLIEDSVGELDFVGEPELVEEPELIAEPESIEEPESVEEPEPVGEPDIGFNLFEQRQLQYFIGKMVGKDIVLDNGEVLRAGERITPNIVTHVTTRRTLMEVTSHLQKN
ncbi:MAG: PRC-barrel domain-containing protein [Desulfosporosinus sp.]|nr:PRC-barrel domain-containing protein [Desulfosporosinus sp.]